MNSDPSLRLPQPGPRGPGRRGTRALVLGALAGLWLGGSAGAGEPPALAVSLARNGTLQFQTLPGCTNYVVEWAPTVHGPWSRSWDALKDLRPAGPQMTVAVPMFYRVVALGHGIPVPPGMKYVGPGEFLMGDEHGLEPDALPTRTVNVSAFFMDRFEVTKARWDEVRAWAVAHGYVFDSAGAGATDQHPVSNVTWHDALKWCNARSEQEGLAPVYFTDATRRTVLRTGTPDLGNAAVDWTADGYRLPTEAEWEKAARGGLTGSHFPWPSPDADHLAQITGEQANFWGSGDPYDNGATPVGYYDGHQSIGGRDMANGYGLYDLAGNVAEMCWDRWAAYPPGAVTDPRGPDTGAARVMRGGSWYDNPEWLRCAARRSFLPGSRGAHLGFRCVRRAP